RARGAAGAPHHRQGDPGDSVVTGRPLAPGRWPWPTQPVWAVPVGALARTLLHTPDQVLSRLLRRPVEVDGHRLAPDIQLLLLLDPAARPEPPHPAARQVRHGGARGPPIARRPPLPR